MAKEPTLEECWREFYNSPDSRLREVADRLAPQLSIREEFDSARRKGETKKVIGIGKIMRKYLSAKDTFVDESRAYQALEEIRTYLVAQF